MGRPDLFQYLDHRAYLKDWFAWKKTANTRFSHRMFARLAGHKNPSLLNLVIKGDRNLTARTTAGFGRAMALDAEESEFFGLLVRLDGARNDRERNGVWARIVANRRFQDARHVEGEAFRYLSSWYLPAIRELAACPGFRADPVWLSRTLRPRITPAQAEQALQTLFELGLLRRSEGGQVSAVDATVVTPHEVLGLAVHNYHAGMIERAAAAIEGFRPFERHLGAVTVAVPQAMVPSLKQEIAAFQERLLQLCDGADGDPDRVYQINLQLFPLTKAVEDSR